MVVFTCNHCGDAVQKPRVEKHCDTVCRRPKDLTCVDCLKDFRGEEYVIHTNCVTEDQRYSAKGTELKPLKGVQKQDTWVGIIQACYDTEPGCKNPKLQAVFKAILGQTNIPRKKPKFLNFIASSMGNRINKNDAAEVFDVIQNFYVKKREAEKVENAKESNEDSQKIDDNKKEDDLLENKEDDGKEKKKSKKRKIKENEAGEQMKSPELLEDSETKNKKQRQNLDNIAVVEEETQANGKSIKQKNDVSDIHNEELKKNKLENEENSTSSVENKTTETTTVNNVSVSPTKKKNKKRNKSKTKQQNGVHAGSQKQNGTDSSNVLEKIVKKGKKKNKNKENGLAEILLAQNGVDSLKVDKEGVVSKAKKRRQKYQEKVSKKVNETENLEDNKIEEKVTLTKTNKKKNKKKGTTAAVI